MKSAGVVVGRVAEIKLDPKTYEAVAMLNIDRSYQFTKDTIASILTSGLLGEQYVSLDPGGDTTFLKDRDRLSDEGRADLDSLIAQAATKRTARAWLYREHLREILDRKQINVVSAMLAQWCTNVLRSKVEPMKEVARMIRTHFDGIVAWTQTRQTNGFIEALNGLFQAAKRKARGYTRFATMRTVLFLIAGKLDFTRINLRAG